MRRKTILDATLLLPVFAIALAYCASVPAAAPDALHAWRNADDPAALESWVSDHLQQQQKLIDGLLAVTGPRTLQNTLRPYDRATAEIGLVTRQTRLLQRVHADKSIRDTAQSLVQRGDKAAFELSLNPDVYRALASLDLARIDPATRHYVQRTLLEYRLAGVDKDEPIRARLKQLRDRAAQLALSFARNINDSVNKVVARDAKELEGLPADYIVRHAPGSDGAITLTTEFPDYAPLMKFAANADLRRQMYLAYNTRAYPANRQVLLDLLSVRQEIAATLGYKTWADLATADEMMRSAANMKSFLQRIDLVSRSAAEKENALVLAFARTRDPALTAIDASSASFWEEHYRRTSFAFDSQSVRPYFPFDRVQQGILDIAAKFFRVRFEPARDAVIWDRSVSAWDVFDNDRASGGKVVRSAAFISTCTPATARTSGSRRHRSCRAFAECSIRRLRSYAISRAAPPTIQG
jgi:thimet oligopeptidase